MPKDHFRSVKNMKKFNGGAKIKYIAKPYGPTLGVCVIKIRWAV
jgi:hypothetical protein